MSPRLVHPESEIAAQSMLESMGCSQPSLIAATRRLLPATLLVLSACVVSLALWAGPILEERKIHLDIGNLLIAIGLVAAVIQWWSAIDQQSMEKYEREIGVTNALSDKSTSAREMMKHHYPLEAGENKPDYERAKYVYLQLDNLEYAIERYTAGISSAYAAARAVMTFENRCVVPEFRRRVKGQLERASYSPVVHHVVGHILSTFQVAKG
jgi:hypothetical protein